MEAAADDDALPSIFFFFFWLPSCFSMAESTSVYSLPIIWWSIRWWCAARIIVDPSTMWLKKWHAWIVGLLVLLFLRIHLSMEFLLTTTYEMVHKCTSMLWGVLRHDILCFVQQLKRSDQIDPISNIYPQHVSVHHSNSCSTSFGDSTIQRVIERLRVHCPSGGYSGLVPPQANDVVTS